MKHVPKGYWIFSALLLHSLLVWGGWPNHEGDANRLHLTQAQWWAQTGTGFTAPALALPDLTPEGVWHEVTLPYAPLPQPKPQSLPTESQAAVQTSWYRLHTAELARLPAPHFLYIPRWKSDGQIAIYGDGRLLYQSHGNLQWNGSNHPLWVALDSTAQTAPPHEIVIRMQHLVGIGGALSSVWVGGHGALVWRFQVRDWLQTYLPFMSSAAFLSVGIFSLFIWLVRRKEQIYGLFFLASLAAYVRTLHYHVGQEQLPLPDEWFGWITVNALFWLMTIAHLFLVQLHGLKRPWLTRLMVGISLVGTLITLPLPGLPDATLMGPLMYVVLLLTGNTAFGFDLHDSWRNGSRHGLLLAGWSLLSSVAGIYDWLLQNNLANIEGMFLGAYANIGAFFIFSYVMFSRYIGAISDVERLNTSLEERLQAREADLTATHLRLREIEQRQAVAQERQRLMQDMHDGLGSSLRTALWSVEKGRMDDTAVADVLKGCIDDLKLAIDSMEPVQADLLLLLATLRFRLEPRLENTGIELLWEVSDVPELDWLDQRSALHILRILQEAFTNIIKHTQATQIRVSTDADAHGVQVTITDNGQGFDPQAARKRGGKGLSNQLRRAEAIGAEVKWTSSLGGTSFILRLPLQRSLL
jgi:signal transduction histidine kinase